jgi:uncharacterized protein (DUF362 family)/Pyruvate/2-oxoacid:ferredoxin oxidoreductase delta subunit
MRKSKVAIVRCETYDNDKVLEAIRAGLSILGGISDFVIPGERIVLKPNVLIGTSPDNGVTTHTSVFKAIAVLLQEARADIYYGDSPAFGKCEPNMRRAGLKSIGDELGLKLADFDSGREVSHKNSLLVKKFVIANGVLDSNGLVSLPRLKTHGFMRFTGAIKNQFGCIPGLQKSQYHVKLPDPYDFARMLVDLNTLIRPRLYILDGITAMAGNGPRSGKSRQLNVLILSSDPVAMDATACRIINLNPEVVPTNQAGEEAGLGTCHFENIDLVGEAIDSFFDPSFEVDRTIPAHTSGGRLTTFLKNRISQKPVINKASCDLCGICVKMCPIQPKAVDWYRGDRSHPPRHNYDLCIRCFCCQETCPTGAILIETPLVGRLYSKI